MIRVNNKEDFIKEIERMTTESDELIWENKTGRFDRTIKLKTKQNNNWKCLVEGGSVDEVHTLWFALFKNDMYLSSIEIRCNPSGESEIAELLEFLYLCEKLIDSPHSFRKYEAIIKIIKE